MIYQIHADVNRDRHFRRQVPLDVESLRWRTPADGEVASFSAPAMRASTLSRPVTPILWIGSRCSAT
jgi:hypothetical protein